MRVIEKILNKLGYYKIDFVTGDKVSEKDILEMFRTYGENDVFKRFLRDRCELDKDLNFQATNERDQWQIHGAYNRNLYFLSLIRRAREVKSS